MTSDRAASERFTALAVWLSVSIAGGALNFLASMLARPRGLASVPLALRTFLLSTTACAAICAIGAALLALDRRASAARLRLGACVAAVVAAAFAPVLMGGRVLEIACVAVASLASGLAASRVFGALSLRKGGFDSGAGLVHASPWIALATCAAVWIHIYAVLGAFSARGLMTSAAWALACTSLGVGLARVPRRSLAPALCAAAVVAALGLGAREDRAIGTAPERDQPKPCVILLTVDTLRADALRAFDPAAERHPSLDALIDESIVFTQARSAAPWTRPALASMHTGLSVAVHGTKGVDDVLAPEVETLAERFAAAGFATAALGDNTNVGRPFGFAQGFQRFDFFPHDAIGDSLGAELSRHFDLHQVSGRTDLLTDRAIDQIDALRGERFFFWLHYLDPHMSYQPPAEYQPPGVAPARIGKEWTRGDDVRTGVFVPSAEERRWIRALYDGELRWVDASIGRVLTAVREAGMDQRCVIVFSSDHGEEFWEHGRTQHGQALYDESIRVPLAIRVPGGSERGVVSTPVSTERIPASILELTGLPVTTDDQIAPSLVPLWRSPAAGAPADIPVVSTGILYFDEQVSVVLGRQKVIHDVVTGGRIVFDLGGDPKEQHPLADATDSIAAADEAERAWREQAGRVRKALGIPDRSGAPLDEQSLQRLRALGYVQ